MVPEEDSPLQKCKHPELPYQVSYRQELSFTICVTFLCLEGLPCLYCMFSIIHDRPPKAMHVHITQVTVWSREMPRKLKA